MKMSVMAQWSLLMLAACVCGAFAVPVIDDPVAFRNATFEKCKKQENAPADAIEDLYYFRSAEGVKDHKCVTKCIDQAFFIYKEDGTFSKPIIAAAIEGLWEDPEVKKQMAKASDHCVDNLDYTLTPCEVNYDLFVCLIKIIKEKSIHAI